MEEYGKPIGKSTVSYNEFENETFGKLYKGKTTIIQVESKYNDKLFNPMYKEGDEIVGLRKIIALELTAN